jgi:hypothetical protein
LLAYVRAEKVVVRILAFAYTNLTTKESVAQIMPLAIDLAERNGAHLTGIHAEASAINYAGVGMTFAVKEFAALRAAEQRSSE